MWSCSLAMPGPDGNGQRPVTGIADPFGMEAHQTDESLLAVRQRERVSILGTNFLAPLWGANLKPRAMRADIYTKRYPLGLR